MTATPVELDDRPGATVVRVRACLDKAVAPDLREALTAAAQRHPSVVVDLSGVQTLDDTGLGLLVRAHRTARRNGGVVCLVAPSRFVLVALHTMHVDVLFPVFADCVEALGWVRSEAAQG